MSFYKQADFKTLYGKALTREEWEANRQRVGEPGWMTCVNTEFRQPHHVGWRYRRCGSLDVNGEWVSLASWTASKIIRPSYGMETAVRLVVNIYGHRRQCKPRPSKWTASLVLGRHTVNPLLEGDKRWAGSCNSVQDALGRADKVPGLGERVAALLKLAYSPRCARAVFVRDDSGDYAPAFTDLHLTRSDSQREWVSGSYLSTHWEAGWGEDKGATHLKSSTSDCFAGGYSGCCYPTRGEGEHYRTVEALGCWLPKGVA